MNRYFKQLEEFKDYYISKNGKIYSKKSNKYIKHKGKYVTLYKNSKKCIRSIKKLITITFNENENLQLNENFQLEMKNTQKFKPIIGFENYLIDKSGNIYSTFTSNCKKTFTNSYGYKCVFLSKENKSHNRLIHRLVYEAWQGKIENEMTIDHIDENKNNNNLDNLQVLSRSDNVLKFHSLRGRNRDIEGFVKIENFDNYYINKKGDVISFKYGEKSHNISYQNNDLALRKDNKRYHINVKILLNKYFGKEIDKQNKKYKNID